MKIFAGIDFTGLNWLKKKKKKKSREGKTHQTMCNLNTKTLSKLARRTDCHRFLYWVRKYLVSLGSILLRKKKKKELRVKMYDSPLISVINRFDSSIHQPLMKISGIPVTFHGLFSHKLKNKRVSFIISSRVKQDVTRREIPVE